MDRRTFVKSVSALVVTSIAWHQGVLVPARAIKNRIPEFSFLTKSDLRFLARILPDFFPFQKWTLEETTQFFVRFDHTVALMMPSVQKELRMLFDVIDMPLLKMLYGHPSTLEYFERLAQSKIPDLRAASLGFNELMNAVYYADINQQAELTYAPPTDLL